MATQLATVNKILTRLRENEVSSVSESAYSKLIGQFVNDAKDDLEDINYEWSVYENEITIAILADGTRSYDVTPIDRAWLQRTYKNDRLPMAFDITVGGEPFAQLFDVSSKELNKARSIDADATDDQKRPQVFAVVPGTTTGWAIKLLFGSSVARTWRTYWYVPQDELLLDGTNDNTEILLPKRPIFLRALYYALNERGEEMGDPGGLSIARSELALAAALESDMQRQKKSDEIDITNRETL